MFKYDNTHIFTGYLKQFLSSFSLPACRIYTREFAEYLLKHGTEDPRVLESFDTLNENRVSTRVNYLKNNELCHYFCSKPTAKRDSGMGHWRRSSDIYYTEDKIIHGLTRTLNSPGTRYDTKTHEYLGDYLRFIRDYHNINLMSLYNCFNNKIYNNVYCNFTSDIKARGNIIFNSQDPDYKIYAIPVKLFSKYTIAINCEQGDIELFCGLYHTSLDVSDKAKQLAFKTFLKVNKTLFNKPFIYDKLTVDSWPAYDDFEYGEFGGKEILTNVFTRWDIANREKDLRLFIKVPASCRSSITILEGDYRGYNDAKYDTNSAKDWVYSRNHTVLNFSSKIDLNKYEFKPISKLQLLAFNTGESYPFADRLVEYLIGSAITPINDIPDNIKRVQRVMELNKNYFKIEGLWEDKMQNILYDYVVNSGPIFVGKREICDKAGNKKSAEALFDKCQGSHRRQGHSNKSTLYDVLGYVDKDTEKWYANWTLKNGAAVVKDNIQNVDIYDGLYDIK